MSLEIADVKEAQGDNVANLESSVKGEIEKVSELGTSISEVKASQDALEDDVATLQSSLNTLQGDIKVKDVKTAAQMEQLKQDFNAKIEDLREEMKSDSCPASRGYVYNSKLSLCYKLYKVALSRDDTNTICKGDTGLLISLKTQEKYNHIVGYLNSLGGKAYNKGFNWYQLWNGLLRENRGKWIWPNGKTTLPRWAPGEPIRSSNRDCGQIIAGGNGDINCSNGVQPFMCEISL